MTRGQIRLALGDKVMQLENDYDREVYNGDVGRITGIDPRAQSLEVTMDGRKLSYAADELDRLASPTRSPSTRRKAPNIRRVVPLLRQHGRMLRRNLLYTAITRARRLVVLLPSRMPWSGPSATPATCAAHAASPTPHQSGNPSP